VVSSDLSSGLAVAEACRLIARTYYGDKGAWAYEVFDFVNATYFAGALPWPHIVWGLTAHGHCLGFTRVGGSPPIITLHSSLLRGTEKKNPWGVDPAWLGTCFAFDVLLHECIHVQIDYRLGGWQAVGGKTSHNNSLWVAEVNRLAPLLGLDGISAGLSKTKRVVDASAPPTKRGRPGTKVVRASEGNCPHMAVATFPYGMRRMRGQADAYYRAGQSPFDCQ
jgi:hypothetical protein